MTLRQTIARTIARHLTVAGIFLAILSFGVMTQTETVDSRPLPSASPAAVMAKCSPVKEGHYPAYVVFQRLNSGAETSTARVMIDKGINDAVFGVDWHNVRVLGFCS